MKRDGDSPGVFFRFGLTALSERKINSTVSWFHIYIYKEREIKETR